MTRKLTTAEQADRAFVISQLREIFPIGSIVTTVLEHVSASGMTRDIRVIINGEHGPRDISHLIAQAGIARRSPGNKRGVRLGGAGMDMGFALTYSIARTLYRDGFPCIGDSNDYSKRCPSNDHANDREAFYNLNRMHSDPGYALNHCWL
jgi:hypothetical protein